MFGKRTAARLFHAAWLVIVRVLAARIWKGSRGVPPHGDHGGAPARPGRDGQTVVERQPMSAEFDTAVGVVSGYLHSDKSFSLPAKKDGTPAALDLLLLQLPDKTLALKDAEAGYKKDGTPASWILKGSPLTAMPIPFLAGTSATVIDPSATLTLGNQDPKPPSVAFEIAGTLDLGATVPIDLAWKDDNNTWTLKIGPGADSGAAGVKLSLDQLYQAVKGTEFGEFLKPVLEDVPLGDELLGVTIGAKSDDTGGTAKIGSVNVGGVANLFGFKCQLTLGSAKNDDGKWKTTLDLTWPPKQGDTTRHLNDLLTAAGAPFSLPEGIDVALAKFEASYDGTQSRLTITATADKGDLSISITRGPDSNQKKQTVLRLSWPHGLLFDQLPLIGDVIHSGGLTEISVLGWFDDISVADVCGLAGIDHPPQLVNLGMKEDDAKKKILPAGYYALGLLGFPDVAQLAFHFPLKQKQPGDKKDDGKKEGDKKEGDKKDDGKDAAPPPATSLPVLRKIGPVSLRKVAFKFEDGKVSLLMDAGLAFGPLDLEALNLRASFAFNDRQLSGGIDGGMLGLKAGPLRIAGGLLHDRDTDDYAGLVSVGFGDKWSLQAAGAYRKDDGTTELFVFGYGQVPIGGPPYLYVTGVALGFGINRDFKPPPVDKIGDFLFVQMAQGEKSAPKAGDLNPNALMSLQQSVKDYLPGRPGENFVSAGITFTSFGFVNSVVLANVAFGHALEIVLIGRSLIDVPKGAPVGHVELELEVAILPDDGFGSIAGALGPGSYVFDKSCLLSGEFAIDFWFAREHSGDFVITFGGYNPHYTPLPHYPQNLARIGFVRHMSSAVTMRGWLYFAVTPKEIMAGIGFEWVFSAGPLSVWAHAEGHFLIGWKPFYYDVDIYIDVGVSFEISLLFFSFTITIDLSARVGIWGPEFTGHADIHLWFVSFGVDFGGHAKRGEPPKVAWGGVGGFRDAFLPAAPDAEKDKEKVAAFARARPLLGAAAPLQDATPAKAPAHDIVAADGATTFKKRNEYDPDWIVDPHKALINIVTTIPARHGYVNKAVNPAELKGAENVALGVRPCGIASVEPELSVDIIREGSADGDLQGELVVGLVPSSLWGAPGAPETIPGITAIKLASVPQRPDTTATIDFDVVAYENFPEPAWPWTKPAAVPQDTFHPANDAPQVSIAGKAARRSALLTEIAARGLLPVSTPDVSSIAPGQPCFMAPPALCRLGADKIAA
jgi:hypothetical protein